MPVFSGICISAGRDKGLRVIAVLVIIVDSRVRPVLPMVSIASAAVAVVASHRIVIVIAVIGYRRIGCARERIPPSSHQQIMRCIAGQERSKEMALGVGGGHDADRIGYNERRESLFDSGDLGKCNDQLLNRMIRVKQVISNWYM